MNRTVNITKTELFIINSILENQNVISELYFLEGKHFINYSKEFEFIKQRLLDIGEIESIDLHINPYLLERPDGTTGVGSNLVNSSLLTIEFLYNDEGKHNIVFIET